MLSITFFILLFGYLYSVNCNDTIESTPAMPQFYTNITFSEFLQKVSPNTTLPKRDVIGGEVLNDLLTNEILNVLHQICAEKWGVGFRATSGSCNQNIRQLLCGKPGVRGRHKASKTCGTDWTCLEIDAHNYNYNVVKFPQCVPRTNVNERHDIGTKVQYEGHWVAPPNSPGTHDFFAEAGSNWNLQWDYISSTFSSNFGHTWSCTACKSGNLKMTHANSAVYAGIFYTGMSFE